VERPSVCHLRGPGFEHPHVIERVAVIDYSIGFLQCSGFLLHYIINKSRNIVYRANIQSDARFSIQYLFNILNQCLILTSVD
jgi:hypothetical protein